MDIVSYRESLGLSQDEAAAEVGLGSGSKGYFSRIERGLERCPLRLALRFERWSGGKIPAESLVTEDDRELLKTHRELSAAAAADQAEGARA